MKYAFEFTTRPAALVATLNRLTSCERFMTVKNLSFRETSDVIVEHINAAENAENQKNSSKSAATSGRRRRGAPAAAENGSGAAVEVDPLVVDPELDAPILVNFILEVRDFGRAKAPEAVAEGESADGAKKTEEPSAEKKENKE